MFKSTANFFKKLISGSKSKVINNRPDNTSKNKISYKSKNISPVSKRGIIDISKASVTHVYFDVHDGVKKIIGKDDSGVYYVGKAVYKNKVRQKISIKLYNEVLDDDKVLEYISLTRDLRSLKNKVDEKFRKYIVNKHFPNVNIVKTQTDRAPQGEWVLIGPYFEQLRSDFGFKDILNENKQKLVLICTLLVENYYEPSEHLILEFLNKKTNHPIDVDYLLKNKLKYKSFNFDLSTVLVSKLKWLAKKFDSENKGVSEYNKHLFEFCDYSLEVISNKKLKNKIINFKNSIRFDKF